MRGYGLLDLILTNKEELVGDVKAGDSPGCNDHRVVAFRGGIKQIAVSTSQVFRRADFGSGVCL